MKYRILTGTGAEVSRLCLGTMTFGAQADEAESVRMVRRALDAGINFFDTADAYTNGAAEVILGKALKGHRDGVVVASKVRQPMGEHPHKDHGLSRWHVIRGVEASLKRLGTECLDILYFHQPDYHTPLEESLSAADQLIRQGKVMYVGMSNHAAWQICQALWFCDRQRLITGKHSRTEGPVQGSRLQLNQTYHQRYWLDANLDAVAELQEIAKGAGIKPVALAFRWLAAQQAVDSIVVGASRLEQLEENLSVWDGELSADTLEACDRVWAKLRGPSYQYNR